MNACVHSVMASVHDRDMDEAFIIMQIGAPGFDAVCNASTPSCFWQSGRAYPAIAWRRIAPYAERSRVAMGVRPSDSAACRRLWTQLGR
jgi:hypothetical protein